VRQLLRQGADVNRQDAHGNTALDFAKRHDHAQVVELLKIFGAQEETQLSGVQKWRFDVLNK
jgi:ankyrin repeat protein